MTLFERVHMPSFAGATEWLSSEPLGPAELRGRVVLVNFWTWTCINWLRQEPYVRVWSQANPDDGLVVIGVHTPEFSFEHDTDGRIRDQHFERDLALVEGLGVEAAADWDYLRTPETYLGSWRSDRSGHWALTGEWTIGRENVVLDEGGGSIAFRFHARDAHLVLSSGAREPVPFRVLLDGKAPGRSHGVDVDQDGNGVLRDGRMYQLVRQHDAVRDRTLEITFLEAGAEAYSFTFGQLTPRRGPVRERRGLP